MSEQANPDGMPETNVSLHALGHFVRVMERRHPGVIDEWVDGLQDEALLNEIIRLRGPREARGVRETRSAALAWAKHVRLVTLAFFGLQDRPRSVTPQRPPPSHEPPLRGPRQR